MELLIDENDRRQQDNIDNEDTYDSDNEAELDHAVKFEYVSVLLLLLASLTALGYGNRQDRILRGYALLVHHFPFIRRLLNECEDQHMIHDILRGVSHIGLLAYFKT